MEIIKTDLLVIGAGAAGVSAFLPLSAWRKRFSGLIRGDSCNQVPPLLIVMAGGG